MIFQCFCKNSLKMPREAPKSGENFRGLQISRLHGLVESHKHDSVHRQIFDTTVLILAILLLKRLEISERLVNSYSFPSETDTQILFSSS